MMASFSALTGFFVDANQIQSAIDQSTGLKRTMGIGAVCPTGKLTDRLNG